MKWLRKFNRLLIAGGALLTLAGCAHTAAMETRLLDQERQIARLRQENKEFQDAYYQIKSTLDNEGTRSQQQVVQLQRELEQARNLQTEKEIELENTLRTRSLELDALRSEMTDFKALTETQLAQLNQNLQGIRAERDTSLERLAKREEDLRNETARATALTEEVATLKVDLQAAQDNVAGLEKNLASANAATQEARAATQEAEKQAAAMLKRANDFEASVKDLQNLLAAAEKDAARAGELAAKQAELEKQLAAAKTEAKGATDAAAKAREEAQASKAAASKAAASPPTLADDAALRDAAAKLNETLKQAAVSGVEAKLDAKGLRVLISNDALFKSNAIVLSDDAAALLDPVVALIKSETGRSVRIEGHTDNQPIGDLPFADNWGLGSARAERVREYLMKQGGIAGNRLTSLTRGEVEPVADNSTPEGRAKNRRVEIVIGGKN